MFKILTIMTVLALGTMSASAHAQNFGQRGAAEDFTGPYLGATAGYGWADIDSDFTSPGVALSEDADVNGLQGGVLAGYGFQLGQGYDYIWNGYVGLEFGYEWSNADDSVFGVGIDKDDSMSITMRPGFTWQDMALGYGIIGYSRTKFESAGEEEWVDGLVLGLGTELTTIGPFKTRLEYVYTNYEDQDYSVGASNLSTDAQENALKLGMTYRF